MDVNTLMLIRRRVPTLARGVEPTLNMGDNPGRQRKVNRIATKALGMAEWSDEEKIAIVNLIDTSVGEAKNTEVRIRVTEDEREEIREMAYAENMTMSNFIRMKIGMEVVI